MCPICITMTNDATSVNSLLEGQNINGMQTGPRGVLFGAALDKLITIR